MNQGNVSVHKDGVSLVAILYVICSHTFYENPKLRYDKIFIAGPDVNLH